jgi:myo-inositol-1(or 4)-monophosphatase
MHTILEKAARAAGKIELSYFHTESHITRKTSHADLVTAADVASQKCIQETITHELMQQGIPSHEIGFIGEENLSTQYTTHMFIIDPLDGTNNFASGLDYFSVSIAYFYKGVVTDSIIYWPTKDILYYASQGKGAFKIQNGTSTRMMIKDELLENSVILTYIPGNNADREKELRSMEKILPHVRGLRLYGSSCLDLVHLADTENTVHIVFYVHTKLWDLSAAYLIVQESGGICTDLKGNTILIDITSDTRDFELIAGHPNVIKEVIKHLS